MKHIEILLVLMLLFVGSTNAVYANCTLDDALTSAIDDGETFSPELLPDFLIDMADSDCFSEECTDVICGRLNQFENLQTQDEKIVAGVLITRELRDRVEALPGTDSWLARFRTSFLTATEPYVSGDIEGVAGALMEISGLTLYANHQLSGIEELNFADSFKDSCSFNNSAIEERCRDRFDTIMEAYLLQSSQNRIFFELLEEKRNATEAYLVKLNSRWQTYSSHATALYPWERLLNAKIFARKTSSITGFVEPPATQYLALHPTTTLEFNRDSDDNFEEALTIEVFGVHRWSSRSKYLQLGASVITSYNQTDDGIGWGALLRLPQNWSIGVVKRGGDSSAVLSVDLARFVTDSNMVRSVFNRFIK